ncbi:hypothetical protein B9N43_12810 [Denitratisoma sp. DHT3]|uniref:hypothetical protein n=1 Tax=Denitratisoma sp. DHT3 TaxID=1981880 RepID=UPI001198AD44|nr:hypothetical protein [Denitratisoma sp. DHT3]QDX82049.1 hypothetical protein B9N43_12810 [Denitratisoma sp. DHT3]
MQLQLSHDPAEDRLLLRLDINGQGHGFWLTRRMTGLLWPVLWSHLEQGLAAGASDAARHWLLALRHQEARAGQSLAAVPPIPLIGEPRLLVTLKHGNDASGRHVLTLLDRDDDGETLTMADDGLHALIRLLYETVPTTGWDLPLPLPDQADPSGVADVPLVRH